MQLPVVVRWLRIFAFAIPLCFLLFVLYWNFLPFGYDETFTINVGAPGDTQGEFHLEPSRDLSAPMAAPDGSAYRELSGLAFAVFDPQAVLTNAQITLSTPSAGVSFIPPYFTFDPHTLPWDYAWDFEHNAYLMPASPYFFSLSTTSSSSSLMGSAFSFDQYVYFDGTSKLEFPNSQNLFESGPFAVYVEWTPEDPHNDFQEIVGHFNWELLQEQNDVKFQVGRMDNASGTIQYIASPIDSSFFNERHSALAIYNPAFGTSTSGYIELYVDGAFAGRLEIGTSTIWADYNRSNNLTLGKAAHDVAHYFEGNVYYLAISSTSPIVDAPQSITFPYQEAGRVTVPMVSTATTTLTNVLLHVYEP